MAQTDGRVVIVRPMSVLGLDVGTTGSRAVIVNDDGTVLSRANASSRKDDAWHDR